MISILHEAPASEPITADALRDYLHAHDADEALLQSLISSARMTVEARSGLRLITQIWHVLLNAYPSGVSSNNASNDGSNGVALPHFPVRAITAIKLLHAKSDDVAQIIAPSAYRLQVGTRPPLLLADWSALPPPLRGEYGIRIEVQAGFGSATDVPESLRLAVLTLAAHWYDMSDWNAHQGDNAIPPQVHTLIAPHKQVRL